MLPELGNDHGTDSGNVIGISAREMGPANSGSIPAMLAAIPHCVARAFGAPGYYKASIVNRVGQ